MAHFVKLAGVSALMAGSVSMLFAASSDKKPEEYQLHFLAVGNGGQSKFVQGPGGALREIPATPAEIIPDQLFLQGDKPDEERRFSLSPNQITTLVRIPKSAVKGGVVDLLAGRYSIGATKSKPGEKMQEGAIAGAIAIVTKTPFAKLTVPANVPQLVCFYQASAHGGWMPPKHLVVDLSPDRVPFGSCLVINLSGAQGFVAVGAGARPATIAPGAFAVLPPPTLGSDGRAPVKIAVMQGQGASVMANSQMTIPAAVRSVIALTPANPLTNAGCPAKYQLLTLQEALPVTDEKGAVASGPKGTRSSGPLAGAH